MKTVGEKLKQRRLELGYSLEDIQAKTKLSILHLRAIEEGDIAYFRHDLSYLKFFLQYYSQALHLDYEDIEPQFVDSLTRYDETLTLEKQEQLKKSNEYIKERISSNSVHYKNTKTKYRIKKSDPVSILVLLLIVAMLVLLAYGVIKFVPSLFSPKQDNTLPETFVVTTPIDTGVQETDEETIIIETLPLETTSEPPVLNITAIDPRNYVINASYVESIQLKFVFAQDTWIQAKIDDVLTTTPVSKVYRKNDAIEIILEPEVPKTVSIRFGNLLGLQVFINDEPYDLDSSVKNFNSGITLNFKVE